MLATGELQELHQIEQELRKAGRGFAWRLRLLQDVLRCADRPQPDGTDLP